MTHILLYVVIALIICAYVLILCLEWRYRKRKNVENRNAKIDSPFSYEEDTEFITDVDERVHENPFAEDFIREEHEPSTMRVIKDKK